MYAERDDRRPGRRAAVVRGRSRSPGLGRRRPARVDRPLALVALTRSRSTVGRSHRVAPARRFHLLGLGERGQPVPRRSGIPVARRASPRSSRTVLLLVTYVLVTIAVVSFAGLELLASSTTTRPSSARSPTTCWPAVGQARRPRDRHLGDRLHPDDDHPGVAHHSLDGEAGATRRALGDPPALSDATVATVAGRRLAIAWYVPGELHLENFLFDSLPRSR